MARLEACHDESTPRLLSLQKTPAHFHGLDTLRAIAILSVIFFHWWGYHGDTLPGALLPVARIGWMGVDLFFVLSGYLIGSQLLRPYTRGESLALLDFYRKRAFRVLPVFFVVLALYLAIPLWRESASIAPAWQYLTFTFNLLADLPAHQSFSHVWSLCVEEHFYLLLPLIVMLAMRRPSLRRTALLVGGFVLAGVTVRAYFLFHLLRPLAAVDDGFGSAYMSHIYYPTYCRLDGLLAGVTLAAIRVFRPGWWNRIARQGHLLLVVGIALVGAEIGLTGGQHPAETGTSFASVLFGFPILDWGLGCIVASALSENGWLRVRVPGAKTIAALAYCLYLTQKQMLQVVDLWFPNVAAAGWFAWMIVYAAACVAVAAALHYCIERPFLWLRDRRKDRVVGEPVTEMAG
jgi:peptidoglycan/LPS O-acetylase OafA/YrhL